MTGYIVCDFIRKYDLKPKEIIFPVTRLIYSVNGTSANLEVGDKVIFFFILFFKYSL